MEAQDLVYGDHFKLAEPLDKGNDLLVWLGDEYDEDWLWCLIVETFVPVAVSKFYEVELWHKVQGKWKIKAGK